MTKQEETLVPFAVGALLGFLAGAVVCTVGYHQRIESIRAEATSTAKACYGQGQTAGKLIAMASLYETIDPQTSTQLREQIDTQAMRICGDADARDR
jgi:hypothetical protein